MASTWLFKVRVEVYSSPQILQGKEVASVSLLMGDCPRPITVPPDNPEPGFREPRYPLMLLLADFREAVRRALLLRVASPLSSGEEMPEDPALEGVAVAEAGSRCRLRGPKAFTEAAALTAAATPWEAVRVGRKPAAGLAVVESLILNCMTSGVAMAEHSSGQLGSSTVSKRGAKGVSGDLPVTEAWLCSGTTVSIPIGRRRSRGVRRARSAMHC
mmetsp:Transcript_1025/g.3108  ORF Transcript_1025/g.3108 Transcript_1025/m.3108 type:complete len:215 (-) Transcript_1025:134-778(-)